MCIASKIKLIKFLLFSFSPLISLTLSFTIIVLFYEWIGSDTTHLTHYWWGFWLFSSVIEFRSFVSIWMGNWWNIEKIIGKVIEISWLQSFFFYSLFFFELTKKAQINVLCVSLTLFTVCNFFSFSRIIRKGYNFKSLKSWLCLFFLYCWMSWNIDKIHYKNFIQLY